MTTEERLALVLEEARWRETQTFRPRFSAAGDCRRKLAYEAAENKAGNRPMREERPVRWVIAARCGEAIGEVLESAAEKFDAETQEYAQIPLGARLFGDFDLVTGTADVVWDDSVWDIKCVGDYAFRLAKKEADPRHVLQVQGYSAALGKPKWALIYIALGSIGKGEDLQIVIHEGDTPPDAAERIADIWRDVDRHVTNETLPERDWPREKCERLRCNFLEQCWESA